MPLTRRMLADLGLQVRTLECDDGSITQIESAIPAYGDRMWGGRRPSLLAHPKCHSTAGASANLLR